MAHMNKFLEKSAKDKFKEDYPEWVLKFIRARIKRRNKKLKEQDKKCFYCRQDLTCHNSTYDHIIPVSDNGSEHPDNFVVACKSCNKLRGTCDFNVFTNIITSQEDSDNLKEYISDINSRLKELSIHYGSAKRNKIVYERYYKKDKSISASIIRIYYQKEYLDIIDKIKQIKKLRWKRS